MQPVRALFAWAFDQVIPERIATVNERTHTPVFSLGLIAVASIFFLYLAAYSTSFLKYVALSTIVGFPTFIMVGISAIMFPLRRKAAYEASVSNVRLLGLPVLWYFGVGSIAAGHLRRLAVAEVPAARSAQRGQEHRRPAVHLAAQRRAWRSSPAR